MAKTKYTDSSIRVLKGLEPVKARPGQFTRTDCPMHILQEVIDNAVDESISGFATNIGVALLPEGFIQVSDDGRGIPVGMHPEECVPTIQAVLTKLYAGAKFDKQSEEGAYSFSGGLHGVGVSVTNALSESLVATVVRDGARWEIGFADGDLVSPLKKTGKEQGSGTTITLKPNPRYFDTPDIPVDELRELLRTKAILLPGLAVRFVDARAGLDAAKEEVFSYRDGMRSFLAAISPEEPIAPVIAGSAYARENEPPVAAGEGAEWAFAWYESGNGSGCSFVNLIPTPLDGTHVNGLRSAIHTALNNYIDHHAMRSKGLKLTPDDTFRSVRFVLSARMLEPGFDNQTKDRLNSRDGVKLVERMVLPNLEAWLNLNPVHAKAVAERAIRHAQARMRSAQKVERKRGSSLSVLPGKLSDCQMTDSSLTELFLVEGDSAGGSAKWAADKNFQAILPLRGKILNTWTIARAEILENTEVQDISTAIGIAPHSMTDDIDWSKLRYGKNCILADADVDGYHIQTLLLTLFFRHFPQLVARGHVYVAQPPLYRVDVEAAGKRRPAEKLYAMDGAELLKVEERLHRDKAKWRVSRFKGLGEMDPPELFDTTLNPATRRLSRVHLPEHLRADAETMFDSLMNTKNAAWRRAWMERRGTEVGIY